MFEVAAIFATVWLLKQVGSPHLLRSAVGSIGGLHLSGVRESHRVRVFLCTALAVCLVRGIAALLPGATANGNNDPPGLVTG